MARIYRVAGQVLFHAIDELAPSLLRLTKGHGRVMLIRVPRLHQEVD